MAIARKRTWSPWPCSSCTSPDPFFIFAAAFLAAAAVAALLPGCTQLRFLLLLLLQQHSWVDGRVSCVTGGGFGLQRQPVVCAAKEGAGGPRGLAHIFTICACARASAAHACSLASTAAHTTAAAAAAAAGELRRQGLGGGGVAIHAAAFAAAWGRGLRGAAWPSLLLAVAAVAAAVTPPPMLLPLLLIANFGGRGGAGVAWPAAKVPRGRLGGWGRLLGWAGWTPLACAPAHAHVCIISFVKLLARLQQCTS
eukprot:1155124-Pelagomonas_calceolata.AAC.4